MSHTNPQNLERFKTPHGYPRRHPLPTILHTRISTNLQADKNRARPANVHCLISSSLLTGICTSVNTLLRSCTLCERVCVGEAYVGMLHVC